jgi:hypothetical protein
MRSHSVRIAFACAVACLTLGAPAPAAAVEVQGWVPPGRAMGPSGAFQCGGATRPRVALPPAPPKASFSSTRRLTMPIPDIVTTAELARLLGCAHDTIRNYRLACVITPVAHGKWDARESVRAVAAHLHARGTQVTAGPVANDPTDLVQQRALLANAQRLKIEREHTEAMRGLLDGNAARAAWAAERRLVREALMALPDRIAPHLVEIDTLHEVRMRLLGEIGATLQALADRDCSVVPEPPKASA